MYASAQKKALIAAPPIVRRCLSCGTATNMARRRYCSAFCRQQLQSALNRRTGLLRALNIRYATFYFSDWSIVMDMLPHGTQQIHSFMLPRTMGRKPVADFCTLSEILGNAWWAERHRTHKRYRASQMLLALAEKSFVDPGKVIPREVIMPRVAGAALISLKLQDGDLRGNRLCERIKSAYRRQAKRHHPDLGGDSAAFRKIQEAYEKLNEWAKHPSFIRRNGFPDKWFYDGEGNRWKNPMPVRRKMR